ncbi:MAG: AAA family ATPase, partial [Anaerolineae bacterium]|nr:AAA family ATPase [Anaerolineae bacterium]
AHGNALENLMLNPTLSDLIGGIESVTLSDEEARRRGTQKSVQERKAPPTFDVLIELQTRDRLAVHEDVSSAVDGQLRGRPLPIELRARNAQGEIEIESIVPEPRISAERSGRNLREKDNGLVPENSNGNGRRGKTITSNGHNPVLSNNFGNSSPGNGNSNAAPVPNAALQPLRLYAYGVARNRLMQSARRLHVPASVVDDFSQSDAIVTIKNDYRRRPKLIVDAERRGTPIYVLRANTVSQIENFLIDLYGLEDIVRPDDPYGLAMEETKSAILRVRNGAEYVDLNPQDPDTRRRQHEMARQARLYSESYGDEPERRVRILRAN